MNVKKWPEHCGAPMVFQQSIFNDEGTYRCERCGTSIESVDLNSIEAKCVHEWQQDYPEDAGWSYIWVKCTKCGELDVMKRTVLLERRIENEEKVPSTKEKK